MYHIRSNIGSTSRTIFQLETKLMLQACWYSIAVISFCAHSLLSPSIMYICTDANLYIAYVLRIGGLSYRTKNLRGFYTRVGCIAREGVAGLKLGGCGWTKARRVWLD